MEESCPFAGRMSYWLGWAAAASRGHCSLVAASRCMRGCTCASKSAMNAQGTGNNNMIQGVHAKGALGRGCCCQLLSRHVIKFMSVKPLCVITRRCSSIIHEQYHGGRICSFMVAIFKKPSLKFRVNQLMLEQFVFLLMRVDNWLYYCL
jgi:hypothetical protein